MRNRFMLGLAAAAAAALLFTTLPSPSLAQNGLPDNLKFKGGGRGKAKGPSRPTPHFDDGTVNFGPLTGEKGVWNIGGSLVAREGGGRGGRGAIPNPLAPKVPTIDEIPWLPWSRALFEHRRESLTADDPHVRCKPEDVARLLETPYGFEIVQVPDAQQILIMGVGGPHSYHVIYMDGRPHPADLEPSYHGHSIGHWEGETLVVDTVGFNTRFWITREGEPTTEQLHLIEKYSRPNYETLRYEITVDDPGAYTAPWTSGFAIPWNANGELYEYICQENNRDSRHMAGGDVE